MATPRSREKAPNVSLVASSSPPSAAVPHRELRHVFPLKQLRGGKHADQVVVFLLKIAALEAVRRISKARCPVVWQVVQGLQVLVCPPFKWIQRWGPFGVLVRAVQKISKPLLCLSIATAFLDHSEASRKKEGSTDYSQADSGSPNEPSNSDTRECDQQDHSPQNFISDNLVQRVVMELEKEGISLPERISEDEIHRFYIASKEDFSCLLSSLKSTIRWRETYYLLSPQELEKWANFVFWHGYDMMLRPCLIIRLGLACSSLLPRDRPRFSQAIVSQIEHGILYLVNEDDPRITVVMDCEGLTPIRFPMQMLKTCATILQDHYPNRLAVLFVVRLPPLSRVITQTFMKVLRPGTRQKLRIEGQTYLRVLSEFLQSVPAFLGGKCTCPKCETLLTGKTTRDRSSAAEASISRQSSDCSLSYDPSSDEYTVTEDVSGGRCEHFLRAAVMGILMLIVLVGFLAGMYDPKFSV